MHSFFLYKYIIEQQSQKMSDDEAHADVFFRKGDRKKSLQNELRAHIDYLKSMKSLTTFLKSLKPSDIEKIFVHESFMYPSNYGQLALRTSENVLDQLTSLIEEILDTSDKLYMQFKRACGSLSRENISDILIIRLYEHHREFFKKKYGAKRGKRIVVYRNEKIKAKYNETVDKINEIANKLRKS